MRFRYQVTIDVPDDAIGRMRGFPDQETANRLLQELVEDSVRVIVPRDKGWRLFCERRKCATGALMIEGEKKPRTPQPVVVAKTARPLRAKKVRKLAEKIGRST